MPPKGSGKRGSVFSQRRKGNTDRRPSQRATKRQEADAHHELAMEMRGLKEELPYSLDDMEWPVLVPAKPEKCTRTAATKTDTSPSNDFALRAQRRQLLQSPLVRSSRSTASRQSSSHPGSSTQDCDLDACKFRAVDSSSPRPINYICRNSIHCNSIHRNFIHYNSIHRIRNSIHRNSIRSNSIYQREVSSSRSRIGRGTSICARQHQFVIIYGFHRGSGCSICLHSIAFRGGGSCHAREHGPGS